jgi:hypothetical protein
VFRRLRQQRLRIGTMDLKIAAIALVHDALVSFTLCSIGDNRGGTQHMAWA